MPSVDSLDAVDDGVGPARLIAWAEGCSFGELAALDSPAQLTLGDTEVLTNFFGAHQVVAPDVLLDVAVEHFDARIFHGHELSWQTR